MSDLHSLIRRSIIDRGLTSAGARQEVYEQARTAVIRELWSYDPPLDDDEIDARIGQFDLAIIQLEEDLAEGFAEPAEERPALPPPRSKRAEAIFEGYDRETDYVPAYVTPARNPARGRANSGSRSARRTTAARVEDDSDVFDPLARRSAAIEEALRSGGDGLVPEDDAPEPIEMESRGFVDEESDPADADDDERSRNWSWDSDRRGSPAYQTEYRDDGSEADETGFSDDEAGEEAPEPRAGRPWTAILANLDERTRIRILISAIAGLGVVLLVIAGFILSSVLSTSGDTPRVATRALVPETGESESAVAAAPPSDAVQSFTIFDGNDPTVFDSGSGNPVHFDKSGSFARVSSSASDPGVRVLIGSGLAGRLGGRSVRVTLVARASLENGAAGLRFAYENGLAMSHWQTANLGKDFQTYNLAWRVPAMRADPNADQLLIEPGIPGDGTAADIQSIRIDLLASDQ